MERKKFNQSRIRRLLHFNFLKYFHRCFLISDFGFNYINKKYIHYFQHNDFFYELNDVEKRIIKDLKQNGIAVANVNEVFGEGTFEKLKLQFENLKNAGEKKSKKPYLVYLIREIELKKNDIFTKLILNSSVLKIASNYLGMIPRFQGMRAMINKPDSNENLSYSQRWHKDYVDLKTMKFFIYMNDVKEENGAFQYITETHNDGKYGELLSKMSNDGSWDYPSDEQISQYDEIFKARKIIGEGKAGDMIFADVYGCHRGGRCSIGEREVLHFHYFTNAALSGTEFIINDDMTDLNKLEKLVIGLK